MPDVFGKLQQEFSPAPSPLKQLRVVSGVSLILFAGFYIFIAMAFAYGALTLLVRSQENARAEFIAQIEQKEQELRPELINQIIGLDKNIENLKTLLAGHVYASQLFRVVEETAHPRVRFANLNFSFGGRKVDMNGEAPDYATVAQQIRLFEQNANIERIDFGGLSANAQKGQVGFQVSLILHPRAIRRAP